MDHFHENGCKLCNFCEIWQIQNLQLTLRKKKSVNALFLHKETTCVKD